ncbi:uncharacterized protein LOC129280347 isoform X2 [Lytechinus pictus]|uniref:uncharacterized protein LOC129280347 isoform X2 n=1 Tax=Lytechinus pictus TaxID=7653 RepID=UPI0030B9B033
MTTALATSDRTTSSSSSTFTDRKRATTTVTVISVSLAAVVIALVIVGIIGITIRKNLRSAICKTKVMQTEGQYMDLEPTNSPAPAYESLGTSSMSKVNETKVLQPTGHCMDPGSTNSPEPTYESVGAGSVSKVTYENGSVVRVEQLIHLSTAEDEHQYESVEHQ